MTIPASHEEPQPGPGGGGFSDAVTIAFGDPTQRVYGMARLGLSGDGASGLAILFDGPDPVAARAEGGEPTGMTWGDMTAGGVRHRVVDPLREWTASFDDGQGSGFDLRIVATSEPAEQDADAPATQAGGMRGYDQLCAFTGTVRIAGAERAVHGLGQRSRGWGTPDWSTIDAARTISAWLGDGAGVLLTGVSPDGAAPDIEAISAFVVADGVPRPVEDPLVSTAFDGEGRQRRVGLELWMEGDRGPHRAAGDLICGSSLDLGRLRYDCAFFSWRMEGRTGIGRYDVLRRAAVIA